MESSNKSGASCPDVEPDNQKGNTGAAEASENDSSKPRQTSEQDLRKNPDAKENSKAEEKGAQAEKPKPKVEEISRHVARKRSIKCQKYTEETKHKFLHGRGETETPDDIIHVINRVQVITKPTSGNKQSKQSSTSRDSSNSREASTSKQARLQ